MKDKKLYNISESLQDEIILAAYKDTGITKRLKIFWLRKRYPEVEKIYREFRLTAQQVHSLPPEECPDKVIDAVNKKTKTSDWENNAFLFDLYSFLLRKPLAPAIITAGIILAIVISVINPVSDPAYSNYEIERANRQARETLLLVSTIFNKSTEKLTKDILPARVSRPISEGMNIIDDLFKEKQNETTN